MAFLEDVSKELPSTPSVEMLGPIPPNMEKRAGRYRAQLLFSSHSRKLLHRVVKKNVAVAQTSKLSNRVRWSLDIDPVDLV
jgi:primosomal protein N' (replication factor Y)